MIRHHSHLTGIRKQIAKKLRPAVKYIVEMHTIAQDHGYFNMKRELGDYGLILEQFTQALIKNEEAIVKEQK